MLQTIQDMSVPDLLRGGALIVGFLAVMFGDEKGSHSIWLKADAVLLALHIPGLLFTQFFLKMQIVGDVDDNLVFLARPGLVFAALIAVLYYMTIKDKDDASIGSWLIARTLTVIALLIVHLNALDTLSKGSTRMTSNRIPTLMLFLTCLGHVIHLLRFREYASEGRGSSVVGTVRIHLLVDVLLSFPFMMFLLMNPNDSLANVGIKGTGPMHATMIRFGQATALTPMLFSLMALQGNSDRDQRACLVVRLLGILVLLPFSLYHHYTHAMTQMTCCLTFRLIALVLVTVNSFVGAFYKSKSKIR